MSDEQGGRLPGASSVKAHADDGVPLDRHYDGRYRGGRGAPVAVEHEQDEHEEHEQRASRFAA